MERLTLTLVIIIACGGSMICSIVYYASEHQTTFNQVLFGCFAGALDLAKYIFFAFAAKLAFINDKSARKYKVLAYLFLVVSIFGTVAFMESNALSNEKTAQTDSFVYQSLKNSILSREAQRETLQKNMERDQSLDFRKRAIEQSEKIDGTLDSKEKLISQLISLQIQPVTGSGSLFDSWSNNTGLSKVTSRQVYFIFFAILLELAGIYTLLLRSKHWIEMTPNPVVSVDDSQLKEGLEVISKSIAKANCVPEYSREQKEISEIVKSGKYGLYPKVTAIMDGEKIGHTKAKDLLKLMYKRGDIESENGKPKLKANK